MFKIHLVPRSRPGELSNSGLKEEDGGCKEDAKDENEDWEAASAGESQVRQSGEVISSKSSLRVSKKHAP